MSIDRSCKEGERREDVEIEVDTCRCLVCTAGLISWCQVVAMLACPSPDFFSLDGTPDLIALQGIKFISFIKKY